MAAPESAAPVGGASNLAWRALSAAVFVPAVLILVKLGGLALLALVLLVVGRCTWEFYYLARSAGHGPAGRLGMALALVLCACVYVFGPSGLVWVLPAITIACLAASLLAGTRNYTTNALLTLGGVVYVGLLGSAPLLIFHRAGPDHSGDAARLVAAVFACIWLTDAAAYIFGRLWGKRKLVPSISPGKTVVGLIAGFAGGLLPLLLHGQVAFLAPVEFGGLLLLVSATGQLGDLIESAVKRDMGVKDTPALIPGHGGALDRFDSYFVAFPAAYLYIIALNIF